MKSATPAGPSADPFRRLGLAHVAVTALSASLISRKSADRLLGPLIERGSDAAMA
jgi:hypothetical protein